MMLDNLSAYKSERVRKLVEGRGCELLYLPPYSPDLNPIEKAFKVKLLLRVTRARTKEALLETISKALDVVSTQDMQGFFAHCDYRRLE
jgi:transposase